MRGQLHAPAALYPRERPGTHCTGSWVGPRAGLDRRGKSRFPPGFDPRTVQPVTSRYTDYATRPTRCIWSTSLRVFLPQRLQSACVASMPQLVQRSDHTLSIWRCCQKSKCFFKKRLSCGHSAVWCGVHLTTLPIAQLRSVEC